MAYTTNDFNKAYKNSGLSFDENDLNFAAKYPEYGMSLIQLNQDLGKAKTSEQRLLATEAINQLRKNYGSYWTGNPGDRSYAASYGSRINDKLDQVTDFDYDPETDPIFSTYKKQFNREGDRAAANALATSAAATGGRPSSYANTAAQQAANYYAAQLADKVPELREQRMAELVQELASLQQQDESDYKRYLDMLNAEYQRDRDAVNDANAEWEKAWQVFLKTGQVTGPLVGIVKSGSGTGTGTGGGTGGGGGSGRGSGTRSGSGTPVSGGATTSDIENYIDRLLAAGLISEDQARALRNEGNPEAGTNPGTAPVNTGTKGSAAGSTNNNKVSGGAATSASSGTASVKKSTKPEVIGILPNGMTLMTH